MLAAVGPHAPTASGLTLALVSNVCFSLRGILGKRIAVTHGYIAGTTARAWSQRHWQRC